MNLILPQAVEVADLGHDPTNITYARQLVLRFITNDEPSLEIGSPAGAILLRKLGGGGVLVSVGAKGNTPSARFAVSADQLKRILGAL